VERIEDRLLLSASLQTGIETQLVRAPTDGYVYFQVNSSLACGSCPNVLGSFQVVQSPPANAVTFGHAVSSGAKTVWIRVPELVAPPHNSDNNLVDVALLLDARLGQANEASLSAASAPVKTVSPAALESAAAPIGVDGASGKCRVFDLAQVEVPSEGTLPKARGKLAAEAVAGQSSAEPKLDTPSWSTLVAAAIGQSKWAAVEHPDQAPSQVALAAANPSAAPAVLPQTVPAKDDGNASVGDASQPDSLVAAAREDAGVSARRAGHGELAQIAHRAAFAEMAPDAQAHATFSAYLLDKRRTAPLGLAVLSIAGPGLARRWWRRGDQSDSYLLPPRRRDSAS
jgi:hypothetical protein